MGTKYTTKYRIHRTPHPPESLLWRSTTPGFPWLHHPPQPVWGHTKARALPRPCGSAAPNGCQYITASFPKSLAILMLRERHLHMPTFIPFLSAVRFWSFTWAHSSWQARSGRCRIAMRIPLCRMSAGLSHTTHSQHSPTRQLGGAHHRGRDLRASPLPLYSRPPSLQKTFSFHIYWTFVHSDSRSSFSPLVDL